MHVGKIIHTLRKDKKMTLKELSEKSEVALATLSRIENEKMTGTLESHMRISDALGVALPDLYRDLTLSKKDVEVEIKTNVSIHSKGAATETLVSKTSDKKMLPILVKIHKGCRTAKEETKAGTEKFVYILEGKLEINIGKEKYNLSSGDTLYFDSSIPHYFKNTGINEAGIISITCPPAL